MNNLPKRKQIRLKDYDYSQNGYYFVTICTKDRQHLLCEIVGGSIHNTPNVQLTEIGGVVKNTIEYINDKSNAKIDNYIIMPNHIHLIAVIDNVGSGFMPDRINGTAQDRSLQYDIPEIVRDLKSIDLKLFLFRQGQM